MTPSDEQNYSRRFEDRDGALNKRLDLMEHAHERLQNTVSSLETKLNIVGLEQTHLKDMVDARLRVIEKSQELQVAKIDGIGKDILAMGNDVDKTPMGRTLRDAISSLSRDTDAQAKDVSDLVNWKNRAEGSIMLLKFVSSGGVIALVIMLLRVLKVLP